MLETIASLILNNKLIFSTLTSALWRLKKMRIINKYRGISERLRYLNIILWDLRIMIW